MIRAELGQLLRLAFPIILTQLSQMGMGVADTVMAGRYSAVDLAGVALGGNLFWPTVMLFAGILMAITPSVSHLHGAGHHSQAGEVVRQASWIVLASTLILALLFLNAGSLYELIGVDAAAIPVATGYLDAIVWGLLPLLGYFSLRYLCEGMSWTLPAMVIAFVGLLCKIPLNYLFMHGFAVGPFVLPAQGGAGCGWASAIIMWLELLVLIVVVARSRISRTQVFARFSAPDAAAIRRLVLLGLPIGLTIFLEFSLFSGVALLIGRLGVEAVAAHQIAMNVGGITYMLPMAVGIAASIRIGFNVGARNLDAARRSGRLAIGVSLGVALISAVLLLVFRAGIVGLYTTDPGVLALATDLMLFVAFWQLADDAQGTTVGMLRGFKDTRVPMLVALVAYWAIGLPIGVVFGFGLIEVPWLLGLHGFWVGFCVALVIAASVMLTRFAWLIRRDDRMLAFAGR